VTERGWTDIDFEEFVRERSAALLRYGYWGTIVGTVSRDVVVDGGITHTMLVDDTATNWDAPDVPDNHKAGRYWRDPVVVHGGLTGGVPERTGVQDLLR
jgi:hypothetical protein